MLEDGGMSLALEGEDALGGAYPEPVSVVSRFRVANAMQAEVAQAFVERPRLVDRVPGFLGLEVYRDERDPCLFFLVTKWTDARSFRGWHDSPAHRESHSFMPRGLRLDPSFTSLTVMERLPGAVAPDPAQLVSDAALSAADFVVGSESIKMFVSTHDGQLLWSNQSAAQRDLGAAPTSLWSVLEEASAARVRDHVIQRTRRSEPFELRLIARPAVALRARIDVHPKHFVVLAEPEAFFEGDARALFEMNNELAVLARELTNQRREAEALRKMAAEQARRDPLTSLYNRRHFFEMLQIELERAKRGLGHVSVMLFDVDHFKRVNDERGHAAGDTVLRSLAAYASARLRPYDIVARYGGEEFVVLLPSTDLAQTAKVAERLRAGIAALKIEGFPRHITASFGAAQWSTGTSPEDLLERADAALYAAKAAGRNRVELSAKETDDEH